mgnify:CR=1 FL=1
MQQDSPDRALHVTPWPPASQPASEVEGVKSPVPLTAELAPSREVASTTPLVSSVPDASDLPGYESWDQYETIHRRNASIVFLRVEREAMFK